MIRSQAWKSLENDVPNIGKNKCRGTERKQVWHKNIVAAGGITWEVITVPPHPPKSAEASSFRISSHFFCVRLWGKWSWRQRMRWRMEKSLGCCDNYLCLFWDKYRIIHLVVSPTLLLCHSLYEKQLIREHSCWLFPISLFKMMVLAFSILVI